MQPAKIISPHDKFFKSAMSDLRVAQDFFQHYLPKKIIKKLDLKTLCLRKESFIEPDLQTSMADLLYSIDFKSKKNKKREKQCLIYILAEHQSTPDKLMPFRILKYVCRIIDEYLKENKKCVLPIVYPLVFYNGTKTYPYSTDFFELFRENNLLAREIFLKPFQLIDLGKIPDAEIKAHQWSGLMEWFMKHVFARDILPYLEQASVLLSQLLDPQRDGENYVISVINYLMNAAKIEDKQVLLNTLQNALPHPFQEKFMTIADMFRAEGRIEGIQEGARLGERQLLIKQLTHRFGYLSRDTLDRIEKADSNILFLWGERVLDVETLDEVFE